MSNRRVAFVAVVIGFLALSMFNLLVTRAVVSARQPLCKLSWFYLGC